MNRDHAIGHPPCDRADLQPLYSVIVPVYRGYEYLERALPKIAAATDHFGECIIVQDGEDDEVTRVCERLDVRFIKTAEQLGAAAARNVGAAVARGEFLVFLDQDTVPLTRAIRLLVDALQDNPDVAAVFGSYDRSPGHPGIVSQYKNLAHHFCHQVSAENAATFFSGFGAVRRDVFERVDGFDASQKYIEDIEFGYRLSRQGNRILLVRAAQITHLKRYNLSSWLRSDILDRAMPWIRLMHKYGRHETTLNLCWKERLRGATALATTTGLVLSPLFPAALCAALVFGMLYGCLNLAFIRFMAGERGLGFAAQATLLHFVHHLTSTLVFAFYWPYIALYGYAHNRRKHNGQSS